MLSRIGAWLRHARATWFPEREIYLRCNGVVRYWIVSRRLQWTVASVAAGAGLWLTISTAVLVVDWIVFDEHGRIAAAVDEMRRDLDAERERLHRDMAALEGERLANQDRLAAARQTVATLRGENEELRQIQARLTRERDGERTRADLLAQRLADSGAAMEALQGEVARLARARDETDRALRRARAALNASEAARAGSDSRISLVQSSHRELVARLRDAAAEAKARAAAASDAYARLADKLRQAQAATADAEAQTRAALAQAQAHERRAHAADQREAEAKAQTALLGGELATLNQRLRDLLNQSPRGTDVAMNALAASLAGEVAAPRPSLDVPALTERLEAVGSLPDQRHDVDRAMAVELVAMDDARHDSAAAMQQLEAQTATPAEAPNVVPANLVANTAALLDRLARERRDADRRSGYYLTQIAALENRLEALQEQQAVLVGELEDRAVATIDGLEDTVYATGLDLTELLRRMDEEAGIGGPYIGLPDLGRNGTDFSDRGDMSTDPGAALNAPLERLYGRLARWKALNMALERVPLTPPVDNFYVSSDFGKRRDPYTGRWAMHAGVDMAGPRNTEIFATAPGVVTRAGWMGQYGTMVEIDHGFGLTTRYGHMRKLLVKKGQTVAFRDRIGIMGSTGRSTSRHVHYEIRFDGEPVDPAKFIEAGRNVFKN